MGIIHITSAIGALFTGTYILLSKKGTSLHKRMGYAYLFCMVAVNITAFSIYELFGGFGVFHFFALLSSFAIIGGIYTILFRKRLKNWEIQHLEIMCWSVVGLYAAFFSEISIRLLSVQYPFLWIGLFGGVTTSVEAFLIRKTKKNHSSANNR